jgi:hypothetical protein
MDVTKSDIKEKAYLFEKVASLEQIRDVALRMKCGKLDMDVVKAIKTKEQMIAYLRSKDCPALLVLEAKMYPCI